MYNFLADLQVYLRGFSAIDALVADRVYVETFPLGTTKPCLTHRVVQQLADDYIGGTAPDLASVTLEFSCWGTTPGMAVQLRDAVYLACKDLDATLNSRTVVRATVYRGQIDVGGPDASVDRSAELFRQVLRFTFWYQL